MSDKSDKLATQQILQTAQYTEQMRRVADALEQIAANLARPPGTSVGGQNQYVGLGIPQPAGATDGKQERAQGREPGTKGRPRR